MDKAEARKEARRVLGLASAGNIPDRNRDDFDALVKKLVTREAAPESVQDDEEPPAKTVG
jgi:hypothetical protein